MAALRGGHFSLELKRAAGLSSRAEGPALQPRAERAPIERREARGCGQSGRPRPRDDDGGPRWPRVPSWVRCRGRGSTRAGPRSPRPRRLFLFFWSAQQTCPGRSIGKRRAGASSSRRAVSSRVPRCGPHHPAFPTFDSPVQARGSGFALSHSVPPNTCVFGQIRLAEAQPIGGMGQRPRRPSPQEAKGHANYPHLRHGCRLPKIV